MRIVFETNGRNDDLFGEFSKTLCPYPEMRDRDLDENQSDYLKDLYRTKVASNACRECQYNNGVFYDYVECSYNEPDTEKLRKMMIYCNNCFHRVTDENGWYWCEKEEGLECINQFEKCKEENGRGNE